MAINVETKVNHQSADLRVRGPLGEMVRVVATPNVQCRYDLVGADDTSQMAVAVIEDPDKMRPEFRVTFAQSLSDQLGEKGLADPGFRKNAIGCARVCLGLAGIDTGGSINAGLRFDPNESDLRVEEVFRNARPSETEVVLGQSAILGSTPKAFLKESF